MRAGRLRHYVSHQTRTTEPNEFGEAELTWVESGKIWASIEPLVGNELHRARQVDAATSHRIRVRHRDVSVMDRIAYGARVFEITAVIDVRERGRELELMCREAVS